MCILQVHTAVVVFQPACRIPLQSNKREHSTLLLNQSSVKLYGAGWYGPSARKSACTAPSSCCCSFPSRPPILDFFHLNATALVILLVDATTYDTSNKLARFLAHTAALGIVVLVQAKTPCILNHRLHVLDSHRCVRLRCQELLCGTLGSLHSRQDTAVVHARNNEKHVHIIAETLLHLADLDVKAMSVITQPTP